MKKLIFAYAETIRKSAEFVFAALLVQSLYFVNSIFLASRHPPLWLYNPVCVDPGQKPQDPMFSLVFCPFAWRGSSVRAIQVEKHHANISV